MMTRIYDKKTILRFSLLWGTFVVILSGSFSVWGNDPKPELEMKAIPSKVYQGESFQLAVSLNNAFTDTPPNMDYLKSEFDVDFLGLRPRNSSMKITINGVTQVKEEKGVTFFYKLTPKNDGKIQIVSPNLTVSETTLTALPVTIEVIPPGDQDLVRLEMTSDLLSVYPLTPFTVTLSVFVKELPGKFVDEDPILAISNQVAIPTLDIAWGNDEKLAPGLTPAKDWQHWITSYQNPDGGFSINHLRFENPFDLGWAFGDSKRNEATFYSRPTKVESKDKEGKTAHYWRYDFTRTFTAEKTGEVDFDAVVLKGRFVTMGVEGKLAPEEVYVISKPLTVTVKDVQEENRPDNYVGAFGKFDLSVELNPKTPKVGEAMTLTVTLKGKGSILNVTAPKLETIPTLNGRYRFYPPTEETEDGLVRWTWSLRPLMEGTLPFPSLDLSYFDVESESFVTLSSDEIPITVEKNDAPNMAFDSVPLASVPVEPNSAMKRSAEGIFENMTQTSSGMGSLSLKDWTTLSASLYLATFFIWGTAGLWRQKTHSAKTLLAKQIRDGREILTSKGENKDSCRNMLRAFLTPASGAFSAKIDAVSRSQIDAFLDKIAPHWKEETPERKTIDDMKKLVAHLEQIQYGFEGASPQMEREAIELYERWGKLLAELGPELFQKKKGRKLSATQSVLITLLCGLTITTGCSKRLDPASAQQFDEAIQLFDKTDALRVANSEETLQSSPSDSAESFKKVAALYEGLLSRGIETGPILYNQGNAFMRAGDMASALASWRRAEKYLPGNPYLAANISTLKPNVATGKRPFIETILFWQNSLSWGAKGFLTTLCALVGCVGFLILTIGQIPKRVVSYVKWGSVLSVLLFGVFFLSLYYDHYRFDLRNHGIVTTDEAIIRKGGSAQYDPLFRDPLPKLTECRISGERSDWFRVRLENGQIGWLPKSDLLVY